MLLEGEKNADEGRVASENEAPAIDGYSYVEGRGPGASKKTGRGRPRKNSDGENESNKRNKHDEKKIEGLVKILLVAHDFCAKFTQNNLFQIGQNEAQTMAEALYDFNKQYNIEISPKAAATINLATVCASIYLPRFLIYTALKNQKSTHEMETVKND